MPNLATVIPAMDHIDHVLTTQSINHEEFVSSIHAAANLAKKTLNRYYSLMDASDVYRVAMILHPRYKLEYFKNAKWEEEWIEAVKGIVHDRYDESYHNAKVEVVDGGYIKPQPAKKVSPSENVVQFIFTNRAPA